MSDFQSVGARSLLIVPLGVGTLTVSYLWDELSPEGLETRLGSLHVCCTCVCVDCSIDLISSLNQLLFNFDFNGLIHG